MRLITKKILLCFFISLGYLITSGQEGSYFVQHFNSENGLPQNSVKGLEFDKKGYLWIATEAGLERFDGMNFRTYLPASEKGIQTKRLVSVQPERDGRVVVMTEDNQYYISSSDNRIETYSPLPSEREISLQKSVQYINEFQNYCLRLVKENKQPSWIIPDGRLMNRSAQNSLVTLNNSRFFFNNNRELIQFNIRMGSFAKLRLEISEERAPIISKENDWGISLLLWNHELFLRWGEEIYNCKIDPESMVVHCNKVLHVGTLPNITCFASIPQYNIFFVGTMIDGLYVFKKQLITTLRFSDPEGNVFYAQAPFGNNRVLTKKGILPEQKDRALQGYTSETILRSQEGHFILNRWISRDSSGMVELDSNLKEIRFIKTVNLLVRCIMQMKNGSIWIGTDKQFLGKLEKDKINWVTPPSILQSFSISTIVESGPEKWWLGGYNGLAFYDHSTGQGKIIPELVGINVRALYLDSSRNLWIGTYGAGYYVCQNGVINKMPLDTDRYLQNTHTFLEDEKGYLWMSTNQGLFQARIKDLYNWIQGKQQAPYFHYYGKEDGSLSNEFNGGCFPSGIRLGNGRISLPTIQGIVQFDPSQMKPIFSSNGIYLDEIIADGIEVSRSQNSPVLKAGTHSLQIMVSSPYFGNRHNNRLQYKLSAQEEVWQLVPEDGLIKFENLLGGKYVLNIRKPSGFENKMVPLVINFTIRPFYYETWWFRSMIGVMVAAIIYLAFRLRLRSLSKQKHRLKLEVEERTKEQRELIDSLELTVEELEQSKEQLSASRDFREKLAMILAHDIQSPLRFLSDTSKSIHELASENKVEKIPHLSGELQKSLSEIHHFVSEVSLWIKTLNQEQNIEKKAVHLSALYQELHSFFRELLKSRNNQLLITGDPGLWVISNSQMLKIILRNLIDNANKYTENGTITIDTHSLNGSVQISIHDSGRGMESETLHRVLNLVEDPVSSRLKEGGYGYRFIADFGRLLNLRISISSSSNKGTQVNLTDLKKSAPLEPALDSC